MPDPGKIFWGTGWKYSPQEAKFWEFFPIGSKTSGWFWLKKIRKYDKWGDSWPFSPLNACFQPSQCELVVSYRVSSLSRPGIENVWWQVCGNILEKIWECLKDSFAFKWRLRFLAVLSSFKNVTNNKSLNPYMLCEIAYHLIKLFTCF